MLLQNRALPIGAFNCHTWLCQQWHGMVWSAFTENRTV